MSTEPRPTLDLPTTSPPNQTDASYSTFHSYDFANDSAFLSGLSNLLGHPGTPAAPAEFEQKPDLVLQAKCFYFNRKFRSSTTTPIDPTGYKTWLTRQNHDRQQEKDRDGDTKNNNSTAMSIPTSIPNSTTTTTTTTTAASDNTSPIPTSSTTINPPIPTDPSDPPPPPYPTSFASIVDLITQNKPIPGIVEVPDTILDPGSSKRDTTSKRRKPWETRSSPPPILPTTSSSNTNRAEGRGGEDTSTIGSRDEEKSDLNGLGSDGVINILRPDAVPDGGLIAKE